MIILTENISSLCPGQPVVVMAKLCASYLIREQTRRYTPMMDRHQVTLPTQVNIPGYVLNKQSQVAVSNSSQVTNRSFTLV